MDPKVIVLFRFVRPCGGAEVPPVSLLERDGAWLLPFVPEDGREVNIHPGGLRSLQTGLVLTVPPGEVGQVSVALANGKHGLQVPCLEVDHRASGELVIPVRNLYEKAPLVLRPGDRPFLLRFSRQVAADLRPRDPASAS